MNDFNFSELCEKLHYNQDTGVFTWNVNVSKTVKAGSVAGSRNTNGHVQIRLHGKRFFAHRLAWFFVHGVLPNGIVDHINGIRNDNRISNLRDVTTSQNAHNQRRPQKGTKSGYLGVSWVKSRKKWQAGIGVNNRFKFIGLFDSPEKAHLAYLEAKKIFHPSAPVN